MLQLHPDTHLVIETTTMHDRTAINLAEKRGPDSQPILETSIDLIDLDRVRAHIERAQEKRRYNGPLDPEVYLRHKQCIVEYDGALLATTAGLVCFGRNPQASLPRAVVDLGHYHGLDPVSYEVIHLEKNISGTIFDQIDRIETYLWANTHHGMTVTDSFQRTDVDEYPRVVLRELSVNMIAHRDYDNFQSAARVQLFRNRIEWVSPGGLPRGVTVENLLSEQASRNPVILSILYEAAYVEAFGQGLDTVVAVLNRETMAPPIFRDTGNSFAVTVAGRPWELFSSESVQLNESQRRIVAYIRSEGSLSPSMIKERLKATRTPRSVQRDLQQLVEWGLVTSRGEGRALRYMLVASQSG